MRSVSPSFVREILSAASAPGVLSLAGGLPPDRFFAADALAAACDQVLSRQGARALQYTVTGGEPELKAWIAERLAAEHGIPARPEELLITTGSQQALDLTGKLFAPEGIAMESPGYLGALLAFRAAGLEPRSIDARQPLGPQLSAAKKDGVEAYYAMSRFQNPRGSSLSRAAREELAALLQQHDLFMIEDDPYGELGFDLEGREAPGTIASLAPDNVIYCGSFSKSIAPSLRMGFVRAPEPIIVQLGRFKQAADLHTSGFLQLVLVELLTRTRFDLRTHLATVRAAYASQRDALVTALQTHLPDAEVSEMPAGGMFLWATLPESTSDLFERAIEERVAFVPGRHFYLEQEPPDDQMRLNYSNLTLDQMDVAIRRLAACREPRAVSA